MREPTAPDSLTHDRLREVLLDGGLELHGRIMPASNATYLVTATSGDDALAGVYKPIAGEKPLWDFPHGTLAGREIAAYLVSTALGWDVVPLTMLRQGPQGPGMIQLWCEPDPDVDAVDLVPVGTTPPGYRHVLDAHDSDDQPVALVHEDSVPLRRMAVFDVVVNNADRKGGHILAMAGGRRYGVDHGICFHEEDKLRTVLWGWAQEPLDDQELADVRDLARRVREDERFRDLLSELLTAPEVKAMLNRCRRLTQTGRMPVPSGRWPAIPWPAF